MTGTKARRNLLLFALLLFLLAGGVLLFVLWPHSGGKTTRSTADAVPDTTAVPEKDAIDVANDTPPPPEAADAPAPRPRAAPTAAIPLVGAVAERDAASGAGEFDGRVVSWSTGAPVPRAELTFRHLGAGATIVADEEGRFHYAPSDPGIHELAVVIAQGFLPYAPEWGTGPVRLFARPGVRMRDIVVTLRPAVEYQGLVLDPDERPVAAAEVVILGMPGGQTDLVPLRDRFVTAEDGRFTFQAPDDALFEARHAGFSPGRARLDLAVQVSHRLTIRLGPPGTAPPTLSIAGRVTDGDGTPLDAVLVAAEFLADNPAAPEAENRSSAQALTDGEGSFTLSGLDPGDYAVSAAAEGLAPERVEGVPAGTTDLHLVLAAGATLRGTVRDAVSSEPVAGFSIVVLRHTSPLEREVYQTATVFDADGRYEVAGLASGDYGVVAMARDHAPSTEAFLAVPDPPPTDPLIVDLALASGARVTGTVIDADSRAPLEHARVSVEAALGTGDSAVPLAAGATTDAEGRFEIRGLTAGLRSIFVAAQAHHSRILSGLSPGPDGEIGPLVIDLRPVAEGEEPTVELTGIGVALAAHDDALVIGRVLEGGGAAEVGLRAGDAVLAVDGRSVVELGYEGSIERIRGPEGSVVVLTIRRGDPAAVQDIPVPRRRIRS
jgi:hypothetical protein